MYFFQKSPSEAVMFYALQSGLAWGFIVLQHILYTLRAMPVRFCKTKYHCGSEQDGYTVWMCCERLWHADALKAMASLNRMVAVQYGQRQTSMHRAKFKLHPRADSEGKVENFFHILKMDMRVTLWDPCTGFWLLQRHQISKPLYPL